MRRLSDEHVLQVAREFASSRLRESWGLFGREIRRAILDSVIMDQMRAADSVESDITYTAADILEFRQRLASTLAAGVVPAGTRRAKVSFTEDP